MSTFLFYEPSGTATRFSNKERFRLRPDSQSHTPAGREPTLFSSLTSSRRCGGVDITRSHAPSHRALSSAPANQRETCSSISEAADDYFDQTHMSDSGDSLRSLFSNFTDELGNPGCDFKDGLVVPLKHPRSTIISPATTPHNEANPGDVSLEPDVLHDFQNPQLLLDSSQFTLSRGRHADPGGAPFPSNRVPPAISFAGIYSNSTDPFKIGRNELPIISTEMDAGTQTDQVVTEQMDTETQTDQTAQVDAGSQTDYHNVDEFSIANSLDKEEQTRMAARGEAHLCPVRTREIQHDNRNLHATNLVHSDCRPRHYQGSPDMALTSSVCPHHVAAHPFLDDSRRNQYSPIHGFFTLREYQGQLAHTLTFFESTADPSLHSVGGEAPLRSRDEVAERLSTMPEFAVNNEVCPMFDSPLSESRSWSPSGDEGLAQPRHASKGQKGDRFSSEDDALLVRLRGEGVPWREIATFFPGRTKDSLQSHYCTKLKRNLSVDGRDERETKRARTAGQQRFDEEASQQLQCELDWVAGDNAAVNSA